MKIRISPLLLVAVAIALLTLTPPSYGTTYMAGRIQSGIHIADGKVLFCQPDETFTILDLATGKVLVRDTKSHCRGSFDGKAPSIILSTHWGWLRVIDLPKSVTSRRMVTAWQLGTKERGGCGPEFFGADFVICAPRESSVVVAHSLQDGRVLWRYDVNTDIAQIIGNGDRVVVTTGKYGLVNGLLVLDRASGRELARHALTNPEGLRFYVTSFKADRLVLVGERNPRINGYVTRTLQLPAAGGKLLSSEVQSKELLARTCGEGALCDVDERLIARRDGPSKLTRTKSVTFANDPDGLLLSGQSKGAPWRAIRLSGVSRVTEVDGKLFLALETMDIGTLECIDTATGQSLWLYVFPMTPVMSSTSGFLLESSPAAKDKNKKPVEWRPDVPKGTVLLPAKYQLDKRSENLQTLPGPRRIILDPNASR